MRQHAIGTLEDKVRNQLLMRHTFPLAKSIRLLALLLATDVSMMAQKFTPAPPPPDGQALIYVYRKGKILGAANYDKIFVNSRYLAALHNSNYAQCDVPAGTVALATSSRTKAPFVGQNELEKLVERKAGKRLEIEVEAGKTYFVKWSVGGKGAKMRLVGESKGAKEIKDLNLARDASTE